MPPSGLDQVIITNPAAGKYAFCYLYDVCSSLFAFQIREQ